MGWLFGESVGLLVMARMSVLAHALVASTFEVSGPWDAQVHVSQQHLRRWAAEVT